MKKELKKKQVFTIGHSNVSFEEFLLLLKKSGITFLADVRSLPGSNHVPQFNKENLEIKLPGEGITYEHFKDLGGRQKALKDSVNMGWHNKSFRGYADYMQTKEFEKALERLITKIEKNSVAIMCAEAVPWRCHRRLIADALLVRGYEVREIIGKGEPREHELTPFAKVAGKNITYPASEDS